MRFYTAKRPSLQACCGAGLPDANKVAWRNYTGLFPCISVDCMPSVLLTEDHHHTQQHFDQRALLRCRTAWRWQFSELHASPGRWAGAESSCFHIWTAVSSEGDGAPCCGQELRLQAAGRTDSGVHARGQCISFLLPTSLRMSPWQLQAGINACLPGAIRLLSVHRARPAFSARHRCP